MENINRRSFIAKSALTVGGVSLGFGETAQKLFAHSEAKYKGIPIGFQTFPIRDMLGKDFAGTL